jgi:choline dehydrogenase
MGSSIDPMSVVDPSLLVIGVDGLRVVDASIMPTLISGGSTTTRAERETKERAARKREKRQEHT